MSCGYANREKSTWWNFSEEDNAMDYLKMCVRSLEEIEHNHWAWKWVCIALHGAIYSFGICAIKGTNDESVLDDPTAFIWEKIPGDHDEKLRDFLSKNYNKELKESKIEKDEYNNIIKIKTEKDNILLKYMIREFESYKNDRYVVTVEINGKKKKNLITDYRYYDSMLRILRRERKLIGIDEVISKCKAGETKYSGIKTFVLNKEQEQAYGRLKKEFRNAFEHYKPMLWYVDAKIVSEIVLPCLGIVESLAGEDQNLVWNDDEIKCIKDLCNRGRELALSTKI